MQRDRLLDQPHDIAGQYRHLLGRQGHPGAQLVRRLGVPCRGDGMITGSKLNDAQAGYEGAETLFASRSSGADLILHAVGWSEFGRSHDRTKAALDEALILGTHIPAEQRIALPAGAFRPPSAGA